MLIFTRAAVAAASLACRGGVVSLVKDVARGVCAGVWVAAIAAAIPVEVAAHGGEGGKGGHRDPNLDFVETPFGRTGDPKRVTRTIRVSGSDAMRFDPARITVREGDTIRFVFTNTGRLKHESVLGTLADLKAHAALMKKFPQMEHEEPFMVHLAPGESGEMIWQFTQRGEFYFGCLMPGHFEAGMRGRIVVAPRAAAGKRTSD